MSVLMNLAGHRFGKLTVIERAESVGANRKVAWLCRCDCGGTKVVARDNLRSGHTKSCGCARHLPETKRANATTHGHAAPGRQTRTYKSWVSMHERCGKQSHPDYKHYGARGIAVCEEWKDFENFLAAMGVRPSGKSLDRIDVGGNYTPTNCRWASATEQARNKSNTVKVQFRGGLMALADVCDLVGAEFNLVRSRVRSGWLLEKALYEPRSKGWSRQPKARAYDAPAQAFLPEGA